MGDNSIFKKIFGEDGFLSKSQFKFIRYLLILILVGIFLMLLGDFSSDIPQSKNNNPDKQKKREVTARGNLTTEEMVEKKLAKILSQIEGVGEVEADVTLESGPEYDYARDYQDSKQKTIEEDSSGGTRKTDQYDNNEKIVVLNKGGEERALIKKEVKPQIRGVLLIAEGAENSHIKASLMRAVKIGLGVPSHKIIVLPKER